MSKFLFEYVEFAKTILIIMMFDYDSSDFAESYLIGSCCVF